MPTVLITGAGRGFGLALLDEFSRRGWGVFPLVRSHDVAAALASAHGATCHPIVGDVAHADVEERITGVLERHGGVLDVLINNAGNIKKLRWLPNTNPEDLESLFRVHCVGALRCTQAVLPFLRRSEKPLIINLTSRWGSIGRTVAGQFRGMYSYQIAKCAQNMLTACLDYELKEKGIRVAAVHPGKLKTQSGAVDADTSPEEAAARLVDWAQSFDRAQDCRCHDLMSGGLLEW
jgi:NAD(P)-dependent dehydrogenase (short-subunit alcohol dehydrogenase family)